MCPSYSFLTGLLENPFLLPYRVPARAISDPHQRHTLFLLLFKQNLCFPLILFDQINIISFIVSGFEHIEWGNIFGAALLRISWIKRKNIVAQAGCVQAVLILNHCSG